MPVPRITKEDLKLRLESAGDPPVIVDARLKYPYEHSTLKLPGAVRLSPDAPDWSSIPSARDVIVYDSDPDEVASERVARALAVRGHRTFVLQGGIADWVTAKLPTENKPFPAAAATAAKG